MKHSLLFVFSYFFLKTLAFSQIISPTDCKYHFVVPFSELRFKKIVSPETNNHLYAISGDNKIVNYDFENDNIIKQFEIDGYINDICLLANGLLVAWNYEGKGHLSIIDSEFSILTDVYSTDELIFKLTVNANYTTIAFLDATYSVTAIDLQENHKLRKFSYKDFSIQDIAFSGNKLLYLNHDGSIGFLDVENRTDSITFINSQTISYTSNSLQCFGDAIYISSDKNIYIATPAHTLDSIFIIPMEFFNYFINEYDTTISIFLKNGTLIREKLGSKINYRSAEDSTIYIEDPSAKTHSSQLSILTIDGEMKLAISNSKQHVTNISDYRKRKFVAGTSSGEILIYNDKLEIVKRATYAKSGITQLVVNKRKSLLYASNSDGNLYSLFLPDLSYGELIRNNTFILPFYFLNNKNLVGVKRSISGVDTTYSIMIHKTFNKFAFGRQTPTKDLPIYSTKSRITNIYVTETEISLKTDSTFCFISVDADNVKFRKQIDSVLLMYNLAGDFYTINKSDSIILSINGTIAGKLGQINPRKTNKIIVKTDKRGKLVGICFGNTLTIIDSKSKSIVSQKTFTSEQTFDFDFLGPNQIVVSHGDFNIQTENQISQNQYAPIYNYITGSIIYNIKSKRYFTLTSSGEICSYSID